MTTHVSPTPLLTRACGRTWSAAGTIVTTLVCDRVMLLFVYVFGGAIETGPRRTSAIAARHPRDHHPWASYTASAVPRHEGGIVERFRSMPIAASPCSGRTSSPRRRHLMSLAVVVAVGVAIGFRSGAAPSHGWRASASSRAHPGAHVGGGHPGLTARTIDGASAFSTRSMCPSSARLRARRQHAGTGRAFASTSRDDDRRRHRANVTEQPVGSESGPFLVPRHLVVAYAGRCAYRRSARRSAVVDVGPRSANVCVPPAARLRSSMAYEYKVVQIRSLVGGKMSRKLDRSNEGVQGLAAQGGHGRRGEGADRSRWHRGSARDV